MRKVSFGLKRHDRQKDDTEAGLTFAQTDFSVTDDGQRKRVVFPYSVSDAEDKREAVTTIFNDAVDSLVDLGYSSITSGMVDATKRSSVVAHPDPDVILELSKFSQTTITETSATTRQDGTGSNESEGPSQLTLEPCIVHQSYGFRPTWSGNYTTASIREQVWEGLDAELDGHAAALPVLSCGSSADCADMSDADRTALAVWTKVLRSRVQDVTIENVQLTVTDPKSVDDLNDQNHPNAVPSTSKQEDSEAFVGIEDYIDPASGKSVVSRWYHRPLPPRNLDSLFD